MSDLPFLTIAEAARLIATRKLSPVELAEACLSRIAALDHLLDSFVTLTAAAPGREAKAAEAAIMAGGTAQPHARRPVLPEGHLRHRRHPHDGDVEAAGRQCPDAGLPFARRSSRRPVAYCWARTPHGSSRMVGHPGTCCFRRHAIRGIATIRRPVHRPARPPRSPPGSRRRRLGTDTGGSIRSPAAACGIAGLKPTYGLVSRRGVIPNCFSHDHAGPLAWTTEDVAILLQVIAGHDPGGSRSAPTCRSPITRRR